MTEFGDRIKAWRDGKGFTQPEACSRLFPTTHGSSSPNARAVHISQIESGRTIMQQSSPDFATIQHALGIGEEALLKMLHAGQRDIRARARGEIGNGATKQQATPVAASAASASKAIDETLAKLAGLAPPTAPTNGVHTNGVRPAKPKRASPASKPERYRDVSARAASPRRAAPVVEGTAPASMGLDGLAADLSYILQKRAAGEPIRAVHHQTMSDFVRRVIVATVAVGQNDVLDIALLAEELSHVMQKRSQSAAILAVPPKALASFVQRVASFAIKLQEVS